MANAKKLVLGVAERIDANKVASTCIGDVKRKGGRDNAGEVYGTYPWKLRPTFVFLAFP